MAETDVTPGRMLRDLVAATAVQAPGAPNALMGRMIEEMGFPAMYLSGAAFSAGVLALPDIGLFTLTELAQQLHYLTSRVTVPVIVDADTGFGDTVNVERTIVELERAGAAAIQLEDQELPKRCGHLSGKSLVSTDAMCAAVPAMTALRLAKVPMPNAMRCVSPKTHLTVSWSTCSSSATIWASIVAVPWPCGAAPVTTVTCPDGSTRTPAPSNGPVPETWW